MTHPTPHPMLRPIGPLVLGIAIALAGWAGHAAAAEPARVPSSSTQPASAMTQTARGTFDVKLATAPAAPGVEAAQLGRMSIQKQFHGDLDAASLGEMLAYRSPVAGSAGYVAMERVEGKLAGRSGSFVLMHLGEMAQGQQHLTVQVVPDSGSGELLGLSGTLSIDIRDGQHFYELRYRLPAR